MAVQKVLLPVDITHPLPDFLGQLNELVSLKDAQVHLVYVKEVLPSYEHLLAEFPDDLQAQIDSKANAVFGEIKQQLQPHCKQVTTEIVGGPAAMMIESVARDEGFDFIVLSPGQHSRVERFLLGSTTVKVVSHGPGTILIMRAPEKAAALTSVVIAVDGSEESLFAAKEAARLFDLDKRDATVHLVNVVSMAGVLKYVSPVRFVAALESNLMMSGEVVLAEAEKAIAGLGVKKIEVHLKDGDPAAEIIKLTEQLNAQLLVSGGQGRSAVEHFLLGSVSGWLTAHARCSNAVIKRVKAKK